ncbi:hypothetical protein [Ruegeria sp. HU-ET01832]|uniref:hypothetical protein n=1 Tax=Ruegeria sp. HU-ET01832 TaxID=3135906 RepID=UPI00333F5122
MAALVVNSRILTVHFLGEDHLIGGNQPVDTAHDFVIAASPRGLWQMECAAVFLKHFVFKFVGLPKQMRLCSTAQSHFRTPRLIPKPV